MIVAWFIHCEAMVDFNQFVEKATVDSSYILLNQKLWFTDYSAPTEQSNIFCSFLRGPYLRAQMAPENLGVVLRILQKLLPYCNCYDLRRGEITQCTYWSNLIFYQTINEIKIIFNF